MAGSPKPPVQSQGSVIVEPGNGEVIVFFPDGSVHIVTDTKMALQRAREYFRKTVRKTHVGVGKIEWRGGLKPPTE